MTIKNQYLKDSSVDELSNLQKDFGKPTNLIKYESFYKSSNYFLESAKNCVNTARVVFFGIIWIYFIVSLIWYILCNFGIGQKIIESILKVETDGSVPSIICRLFDKIDIRQPIIFITVCMSLVIVYFIKRKYQKDKNIDDVDMHSEN